MNHVQTEIISESKNSAGQKPPRVSVIIPSYNHAHYVQDAIQSVLNQDYDDYEIIVIDDGSKDNTREVVARFGEKIRYIWQENKGLPGARNTGIKAANGDLIALLDSDDTWLPGFLSATVARLEGDPRLGAVHTGFYFVDEHGQRLPQVSTETVPDDQMYDRLLDGEFFVPAAVVTRRECFDRVGLFDEAFRGSEDWDIWLRVARAYRFAGIPTPLVNYRMHSSNMTKDPEYMLNYQLMVVEKHFGLPDGAPERWPPERQRAYAAVYRYAAQGFFLRGDKQLGQHYLRLALEANPALAESVDMFYELGCANQPLGWRGDLAQLNFEENSASLLSSLTDICAQSDLSSRLRARKRVIFAHAYLALGLLAYGSHRLRTARSYLWRALVTHPRLGRRREVWVTLSKTMMGQRLIHMLRSRSGTHRVRAVR
jgi:glycosyltransferase involved in cell wall biosynthesis